MSANGRLAARPETASWNAPSTSSSVSASTIVPPWTSGSKPALARNSGSRSTATFTLTVPLRDFHCVIVSTKSSGSADGSICSRKVIFGCVAAITTSARSSSPDSSTTPRALSVAHVDASDARVRADRGTERLRRAAQRAGDTAHPAAWKAPRTELAVADVADLVVRHHVRGARRTRPGPRADDAAHREDPAHLRRLEPVVEQIGDAAREQAGDIRDAGNAQPAQLPCEPALVHDVARTPRSEARRDRR